MASGQPQNIGEQLITEVAELFESAEPATPFDLARLTREANKLQAVDAVAASVAKSGIAAYEWDYEEAMRWVTNALRLNPTALTLHNAAVTMRALNDFTKAREFAIKAAEAAFNDPVLISKAINSLVMAGGFTYAYKLAKRMAHTSEEVRDYYVQLERLLKVMDELGVTEQRITSEIEAACSVARSRNVRIHSAEHLVASEPDGRSGIVIPLKFHGDLNIELALEEALAAALAEDPQWDPIKLSIEFSHE